MPRRSDYESDDVVAHIRARERVVTHKELIALGVPKSTIVSRVGRGGPWQRIIPGVALCHRGIPTTREKYLAALAYGGPGAVLSGWSALDLLGLREQGDPRTHLLVPHQRHRTSHFFVVVERTTRMPEPVVVKGLPVAPMPRSVIDACRRPGSLDKVRAVVAESVQRRRCDPAELLEEARRAPTQRMALTNAALREIEAGVRSVAEARARLALRDLPFPPPEWNVTVVDENGEFVAVPDAWDDEVCAAIQVDSMEWHLSPAQYKATQKSFVELQRRGGLVLPVAPSTAEADPRGFREAWIDIRMQAAARPRPRLYARRTDDDRAA